jgi:squalene synthase HpnC
MAVYAFARFVDDLGDAPEGGPSSDRLARLDAVDADIDRMYAGRPTLPVTTALLPTALECQLPAADLHLLVEANRCDQVKSRYETYTALRGYCTLSADPIGRLVLHVFGAATPERFALSDRICTALQLVEHWQDVREDYLRGRVYLPQEDLRRFGVAESDLGADHSSPALRKLISFEVERTRQLLDLGVPLVRTLRGRAAAAIAAFAAGGRAALRAIEAADFDVLPNAPRPGRMRVATQALRILALGR